MLSLFPAIEPFHHFYLAVTTDLLPGEDEEQEHQLYVEQCGNPSGIPVVFLHGGPGSGCKPSHRCFFDPKLYHIILFDQRGAGRSQPKGSLTQNKTAHLIQDIESIRRHIGIDNWLVFGGSWGTTLGLCYAHQYPESVTGLILRGIFLARQQDIDWVYAQNGAAKLYPDAWKTLVNNLPPHQQAQPLAEIYQQLTRYDSPESDEIFEKLQNWESSLVYWQKLVNLKLKSITFEDKVPSIIQLYYSLNQCFLEQKPLINLLSNIRHLPAKIIHGRHDMVCPVEQAWLLKANWPEADLAIIEMAGHVANEPKIINALINATNDFAKAKMKKADYKNIPRPL